MLKIAVHTLMCREISLEHAVMITMLWSYTCSALLSVTTYFHDVIISLTIEVLCKSAVIMIELTVLELAIKE